MSIKKELGKKIKHIRTTRGYTQEKLAEMLNISQKALSSIEAGKNFVTAETFDNMLCAFDTTAEELFATNSFKEAQELIRGINRNISEIGEDSEKLEIIYNLTKSLARK